MPAHVYVGLADHYEKICLCDADKKPVREVLWGDFLTLDPDVPFDPNGDSEWVDIVWGPNRQPPLMPEKLKIRRAHVSLERPLEIVFVDVGQGDGAVMITPERDEAERIMVIDAGIGTHMAEFLNARFHAYRGFTFHAAIITHPDKDHYYGFRAIFADPNIRFEHLYHSGLVERPIASEPDKWAKLGGRVTDPGDKQSYIEALVPDDAMMRGLFGPPVDVGTYAFANVIRTAIDNNNVGEFAMLAKGGAIDDRVWMPGFAPSDHRGYSIEVIGPLVETGPAGKARLRTFPSKPRTSKGTPSFSADFGKTKNGHSVLLRLVHGDFSILFGGDLNRPAEEFLLKRYGKVDGWLETSAQRETMIANARPRLRSDVMKSCHHGSSDVTDEFLEAVDPAAFVISSGDEEGHVHPRPDLLGRLGKKGRGHSPVLLSTELQRSTREDEDAALVAKLLGHIGALSGAPSDALRQELLDGIRILGRSNVSVDGAIYLKTDGKRLIAAFKKETSSAKDKWFYFEYRIVNDVLILVPRGGH